MNDISKENLNNEIDKYKDLNKQIKKETNEHYEKIKILNPNTKKEFTIKEYFSMKNSIDLSKSIKNSGLTNPPKKKKDALRATIEELKENNKKALKKEYINIIDLILKEISQKLPENNLNEIENLKNNFEFKESGALINIQVLIERLSIINILENNKKTIPLLFIDTPFSNEIKNDNSTNSSIAINYLLERFIDMTVKSEVIGQLFISSTMIENQKIYMDNNK
jgi:hypothetical protein